MKHSISTIFPLLIMLMLAALTFWLKEATQADGASNSAQRHDPDFFVENFVVNRFNAQGKLQNTLRSPKMRHFPDDDTTAIDFPDMEYFSERPTRITANSGWTNKDGKEVILTDNVVINRTGLLNAPATVITTTQMTAYPDDEIARTDKPVVITQGKTVVHGIGLESNNKTHIAVLGGRVQGTIYPKSK
jgi:lipopolysaccharide export system protein LptC